MASSENSSFGSSPWPTDIRISKDRRELRIVFDDGSQYDLPAEYLRVESPSAEVRGHGGDDKKIVPGKADVTIIGVEPVGNYAVRLIFDDGHETGLYSWPYLLKLGQSQGNLWADYLAALEQKGLSRRP